MQNFGEIICSEEGKGQKESVPRNGFFWELSLIAQLAEWPGARTNTSRSGTKTTFTCRTKSARCPGSHISEKFRGNPGNFCIPAIQGIPCPTKQYRKKQIQEFLFEILFVSIYKKIGKCVIYCSLYDFEMKNFGVKMNSVGDKVLLWWKISGIMKDFGTQGNIPCPYSRNYSSWIRTGFFPGQLNVRSPEIFHLSCRRNTARTGLLFVAWVYELHS